MSDDNVEIIKAGAQGIVEGAMKPFNDLIKALFGPAVDEAGSMLKESVQHFRQMRRIRFLQRTRQVLANAQIKPERVSLKLLLPIIENASNEEDDSLQDIWANLLANAADPGQASRVYPSFPAILKELTARDVKFLDALFRTASVGCETGKAQIEVEDWKFQPDTMKQIYSEAGLRPDRINQRSHNIDPTVVRNDNRIMRLSVDTFERHGVLVKTYGLTANGSEKIELGSVRSFTVLGAFFVQACRAPKKSS